MHALNFAWVLQSAASSELSLLFESRSSLSFFFLFTYAISVIPLMNNEDERDREFCVSHKNFFAQLLTLSYYIMFRDT